MFISLVNPNKPTRFWIDDQQYVDIRVCSGKDLDRIAEQCTQQKVDYKRPTKENGKEDKRAPLQRIEWIDIDRDKHRDLLWDFCLVDWFLIDSATTEAIPCTTENKLKLMTESPDFAIYVAECLERITEDKAEREKEIEKNSQTSPKPSEPNQTALTVG